MQKDEVLRLLTEHREDIAKFGVKSIAIFGSVARDEAGPDGDVDILVEVGVPVGLFQFVHLKMYLEDLLVRPVGLVIADALREVWGERSDPIRGRKEQAFESFCTYQSIVRIDSLDGH